MIEEVVRHMCPQCGRLTEAEVLEKFKGTWTLRCLYCHWVYDER